MLKMSRHLHTVNVTDSYTEKYIRGIKAALSISCKTKQWLQVLFCKVKNCYRFDRLAGLWCLCPFSCIINSYKTE